MSMKLVRVAVLACACSVLLASCPGESSASGATEAVVPPRQRPKLEAPIHVPTAVETLTAAVQAQRPGTSAELLSARLRSLLPQLSVLWVEDQESLAKATFDHFLRMERAGVTEDVLTFLEETNRFSRGYTEAWRHPRFGDVLDQYVDARVKSVGHYEAMRIAEQYASAELTPESVVPSLGSQSMVDLSRVVSLAFGVTNEHAVDAANKVMDALWSRSIPANTGDILLGMGWIGKRSAPLDTFDRGLERYRFLRESGKSHADAVYELRTTEAWADSKAAGTSR